MNSDWKPGEMRAVQALLTNSRDWPFLALLIALGALFLLHERCRSASTRRKIKEPA